MVRWWEEVGPPVYISVASYLGLVKTKKKAQATTKAADPDSLEGLAAMFRDTGGHF